MAVESVTASKLSGQITISLMNSSMFNFSDVEFSPVGDYSKVVSLPLALSLIALVGIVGNVLVVAVTVGERAMRTPYNLMLTNLAAANLLFLVLCIPTHILQHVLYKWPLGDVLCKVVFFMIFVSVYVEVYTLVVLCVSRFVAVLNPVVFSRVDTKQNAVVACVAVWAVFLVCNLALLPEYQEYYLEKDTSVCVHTGALVDFTKLRLLWTSFFVFACLIPLLCVCILSVLILYYLHYPGQINYDQLSGDCIRKRRLTITVVVVVIAFSLCWLPLQILMMVDIYAMPEWSRGYQIAEAVCVCLAYSNASLNPIIYNFMSTEHRTAFARLLCSGRRTQVQLRREGYSQRLPEETAISTI